MAAGGDEVSPEDCRVEWRDPAPIIQARRMARWICPECGRYVAEGYRPAWTNDGDVEPSAHCTNPDCDFWY